MNKFSTCLFFTMLNIPLSVTAGFINFGSAEDYIIATASTEQWSGNLLLGSEAHVFGSVAASNTLELGDGVIVDGDACAGTTNDWGASVAGATGTCADFNQLANDISGAATQAEGFSGSYLDNVSGSLEVFGGGFQSFSINNLLLSGGDALTVTGNVDDYFIFNIFGEAKLGSGSNILLQGGVTADNVVFNFVKNLNYQNFELGGANISGTFLSSGRTFIIGDGATLKNSRFYSTESIVANVQDVHFPNSKVSQVEVPEPTTLAIFVLGLMGLASRRFKENA